MAADNKKSNNALAMTLLKGRTFIVLIILMIFFSITANNFLTVGSLLTVAKHVALYGILAIGMTYVIITGGIDLSVGRCDYLFQHSAGSSDHSSSGSIYWSSQRCCDH